MVPVRSQSGEGRAVAWETSVLAAFRKKKKKKRKGGEKKFFKKTMEIHKYLMPFHSVLSQRPKNDLRK